MGKLKIKLNHAAVSTMMKSGSMQLILEKHATAIRNRSGSGYKQDIHVGRNRANAMVWPDTYQAKADNARNNTLLKAMK